ncbi:hypothetical protein L4D77_06540 [Photobacterium frigidiphilum]|uniref:hypothetical protein n=1 Tax=Photobacterium frigidiphilum TaxID=264736 RepID=UPI003D0D624D
MPEALEQFHLLHKVNSANPLRELIIANLYAVLQQHKKAAIGYLHFIKKVTGISRYSFGVYSNFCANYFLYWINFELCGLYLHLHGLFLTV